MLLSSPDNVYFLHDAITALAHARTIARPETMRRELSMWVQDVSNAARKPQRNLLDLSLKLCDPSDAEIGWKRSPLVASRRWRKVVVVFGERPRPLNNRTSPPQSPTDPVSEFLVAEVVRLRMTCRRSEL
jgi:hypothetical protein